MAISINDIENIDNSNIKSTPSKTKYKTWTNLMNWGMRHFIPKEFDINIKLHDYQTLNNYGLDLKIIPLPGHTNGSIGILYKDYLFAGDALVNRGKHPTLAYQNQDNNSAKKSVQTIIDLNPKIVFVGHDNEFKLTSNTKNTLLEINC